MNRMKFMRYGKWIIGAAAAASVSVAATHYPAATASIWTPPIDMPESYSKWDYNWDKREPYSLVKPPKRSKSEGRGDKPSDATDDGVVKKFDKKKAKASRHLILIRHGQYNTLKVNENARSLTDLGRQQAKLTGVRLKTSGMHFDSIMCSNMTRAIETANIILKHVDQLDLNVGTPDPFLREGFPCVPDPPVSTWYPDLQDYYEDGARIEAAFRKYFHRADPDQEKDSYEIIVCHANVIRYFTCRALQFPREAWLRISLHNCSLTEFTIYPSGRVILRALGDSGHIPILMKST